MDVAKLLKLKASAELAKRIVAGNQLPNSLSSFQMIVEGCHQRKCRVCKHHLTLVCLESL